MDLRKNIDIYEVINCSRCHRKPNIMQDDDGYYVECVLCREIICDETNILCTDTHELINL